MYRCIATLLLASSISSALGFDLVRDYSGQNFFNGWNFYGSWDNLTLGNVWWLNQTEATATQLAYINDAGRAVMKVDNTSTITVGENRNSIRIESTDFYDVGSLWIVDMVHMPFGCSVWPAFWTKGPLWPNDGEIDIVEAINLMQTNQMALHTTTGCLHPAPPDQKGKNLNLDCGTGTGCTVGETAPNSYGPGFAAAGGGVWATQFDTSGIFIWYWSRPDVPSNLQPGTNTSTMDITTWGPPTASYPSGASCNITEFFTAQQLVFDITLCGDWAGVESIYRPSCGTQGPTGLCYNDTVVGNGSNYADAYFEVNYVRAYSTGPPVPSPTAAPGDAGTNGDTTITSTVTPTGSPTPVKQNTASGATVESPLFIGNLLVLVSGAAAVLYTLTIL
ncbi:hypothetical protein EUX98_g4946 [Antrodiella citrinella]|uniref:GH16 domain-containing protein n=1 Tax=Antrodiella citrinella TaxID=2447956 RepID=A0A4S4N0P4_9APHY|nr:hypothetical protein EUX98_g4946 [Antrodiella citrinella]